MNPLHKLLNSGKNFYVYDTGTSHIFEIDQIEYEILKHIAELNLSFDEYFDKQSHSHHKNCPGEIEGQAAFNRMYRKHVDEQFMSVNQLRFRFSDPPKEIKNKIKGKLTSFCISLTQSCNFRCDYCTFGDHYPQIRTHSALRMKMETLDQTIDFIIKNSSESNKIHVGFYGGEPLLEFKLIEHAINSLKQKIGNEKLLNFAITTNFFAANEYIIDYLYKHNVSVYISLDGSQEIHDRYRKTVQGDGTFNRILANLQLIRDKYPEYLYGSCMLNVVLAPPFEKLEETLFYLDNHELFKNMPKNYSMVTAENTTFFEQFESFYKQREIFANVLQRSKRSSFRAARNEPNVNYSVGPLLFNKAYGSTIHRIHNYSNGKLRPFKINENVAEYFPQGCCLPLVHRTHISCDGKIYLCEKDHEKFNLGNVWSGVDYDRIISLLNAYSSYVNDHCSHCWAAPLCGSCFLSMTNDECMTFDKLKFDKSCASKRANVENGMINYLQLFEDPIAFKNWFE